MEQAKSESASGPLSRQPWHTRHRDFEPFDRISFEVVPRYKESGLSGDEWRQHVEVTFYFKGHAVYNFGCRDMQAAAMLLGHHLIHAACPIPDAVIQIEKDMCDQPSCCKPPVYRYTLKNEYSADGHKLDESQRHSVKYRQFCERHKTRGDCALEDADDNYSKESL